MSDLIHAGFPVNQGDYDGRTAMHIASSNNFYDIVRSLVLVPGINVNPVDKFEMTPLHDAILNDHTEIVALLKKKHGVILHRDLGYKLCNAGFNGDINTLQFLWAWEIFYRHNN